VQHTWHVVDNMNCSAVCGFTYFSVRVYSFGQVCGLGTALPCQYFRLDRPRGKLLCSELGRMCGEAVVAKLFTAFAWID
jgi:hypothetical protein